MSTNALGHEIDCLRDAMGERGKLHHVAFYYGTGQHNIDAAEMFREYDIRIEAGRDKHGITQASSRACSSPAAIASNSSASPAS
jgi:catechol 2,3-dioxygenase